MKLFNKEKDIIRIPFTFNYTELTAVEEYLCEQEEKGLRLKEIDGKNFVFEKAEPRKIRYSAELYTGSFPVDFKDTCENEGWECAGVYNNELFIFRTQNSDITEIMTDENDKFRIIAKRVLLQPGYLWFSGWVIFRLIHLLFLRSDYEPLIETSIYSWIEITLVTFYLTHTLLRLIEFFTFLQKSKKRVKTGERIPFSNLKEHKQSYAANKVAVIFLLLLEFALILILGLGYVESEWFFIMCGVPVLVVAVSEVDDCVKKCFKGKAGFILTLAVALLIAAGTFAAEYYNRQLYAENTALLSNEESLPVSLSDFGIEEKNCENSVKGVDATRLAQCYNFYSKKEKEYQDEETQWLYYQVFVSDYPEIRQRHINKLIKLYNKRGAVIMKMETGDAGWDEYYREFNSGEMTELGFAVKDNMVIYVDICWKESQKDFFEVAYEKLFADSK